MLRESIKKIFQTVQENKTCFRKQLQKLKHLYSEADFNTFLETFLNLLKPPLCIGAKSLHVENILEFATKFCISVDEDAEDNPFLTKIFQFIINHSNARDRNVRYRLCYFLTILLNSMGEDAIVDDELYDQISYAMLNSVQDKSPKVRAQAVLALQRLQDPETDNCPIIKVYIFHMTKDPCHEVRENIIKVIAKNKKTLAATLKRISDVNANVRKAAFKFISKVTVRSLTISQREEVLKCGLNDLSPTVVDTVKTVLLPSWLQHFNHDYIAFLKGLDAESCCDMSVLILKTLLEKDKTPWRELMQQVEVDEATQLIPIDKISSEKLIFWRCLVEHIKLKVLDDEMETILPDLTPFCTYIQDYITHTKAKRYEFWEEKSQEIVLYQLFEMIKLYDLSDESGKKCLKQLLLNTLKHSHQTERIVNSIVGYLHIIVTNTEERFALLLDIINELRMPLQVSQVQKVNALTEKERHNIKMQLTRLKVELLDYQEEEYNAIQMKKYLLAEELKEKIAVIQEKMKELMSETTEEAQEIVEEYQEKNDPETLISCLRILTAEMKYGELKTLTPTLKTLMENLALVNILHPDKNVRKLALLFLGICCMLDKQLAKKHIFSTFLVQFSLEQESSEICEETLEIIFDLLCLHGLEFFDINYNEDDNDKSTRKNKTVRLYNNHDDSLLSTTSGENRDIMELLTSLMNCENVKCRRIATVGLMKLMANEILLSSKLLSRILIQLHNPALKSDMYLMQYIIKFLNYFAKQVPESQKLLENSFFTILKLLETSRNAFYDEINDGQVLNLVLILTRNLNEDNRSRGVHNTLIQKVIEELLDYESDFNKEVLLKILPKFQLQFTSAEEKKDIIDKLEDVKSKLQDNYTRFLRCVEKLKAIIQDISDDEEESRNEVRVKNNNEMIEELINNTVSNDSLETANIEED